MSSRCDGKIDCKDGSDERCCSSDSALNETILEANQTECSYQDCLRLKMFPCTGENSNNVCLDYKKIADGVNDCFNNCDENWSVCDKNFFPVCENNCFECKNGIKVSMSWNWNTFIDSSVADFGAGVCNGVDNCGDGGSDETCCPVYTSLKYDLILDGFRYEENVCDAEKLSESCDFVCNGWKGNNLCLQKSMVQDSINHCSNKCDEIGFNDGSYHVNICENGDYFECDNKYELVMKSKVCDGFYDCSDGSDEKDHCCAQKRDRNSLFWRRCSFKECERRGRFKCAGLGSNGKCLSTDVIYDGKNDCGNGCDELSDICEHAVQGNSSAKVSFDEKKSSPRNLETTTELNMEPAFLENPERHHSGEEGEEDVDYLDEIAMGQDILAQQLSMENSLKFVSVFETYHDYGDFNLKLAKIDEDKENS